MEKRIKPRWNSTKQAELKNLRHKLESFGFIRLDIPIAGGSAQNFIDCHLRTSNDIFKAFILYRYGSFNLVQRGGDGRDARVSGPLM
jgi:hypothetical protein